jgi:hypothetical protein
MIEAHSRPAYVYLKVKIAPPCFGLFAPKGNDGFTFELVLEAKRELKFSLA